MKSKSSLLKLALLLLVIIIVINSILPIFTVSNYPVYKWKDFYATKNNTIDIVSFGSSHIFRTLIPCVIDNELEIDTYNMGIMNAKIHQNYYQLVEVLKTQKPKLVILETFSINEYGRTNTQGVHHVFDSMKLSPNKLKGIYFNSTRKNILENSFPLATYHLAWKETDFLKAYRYLIGGKIESEYFQGFVPKNKYGFLTEGEVNVEITSQSMPSDRIDKESIQLLNKFHKLCVENDIELLLVASPYTISTDHQKINNYINDYAKKNNIDMIDYNTLDDNVTDLNKLDFADPGHLNITGAYKVTEHLTNYIKNEYSELFNSCTWNFKKQSQEDFELLLEDKDNFIKERNGLIKNNQLKIYDYKNNFAEYISTIDKDRHIIIVSTKNNSPKYLDDDIVNNMKNLGLDFNISNTNDENYIAVVNSNNPVLEIKSNNDPILLKKDSEQIQSLNLPFELEVKSSHINTGSNSMINIDTEEYSKNQDGFNIIVYDKILNEVISSTNFNLNEDEQHYFNRNLAQNKFDVNNIIYTFDTNSNIQGLLGASGNDIVENGVLIHSNSNKPRFELTDFETESNHILLKAEIECPYATWFEIRFNELFEREQLVTGNNIVYIEICLDNPIKDVLLSPANSKGDYLIKNIEICDLSN